MYWCGITIVFCFLAGVQSQPYEPHFEVAPEAFVEEGDSITFKCAVNEGPLFMAGNILQIAHKSAKSGTVDIISEQANLVQKYKENGYTSDFSFDPVCSVTITISPVTADIDGEYLCQVKKSTGDAIDEEVTAPVTVLGGVDRVELKVDNSVVENDGEKLAFRAGSVSVGCVAFGSNPEPVVELMMGEEVINGEMNAILDKGSAHPRRSYQGAVTATLDFNHQMFGKKLSCKAGVVVPAGSTASFPESSHSAILEGIVDEPNVKCTNNTASMGDRRITLKCTVSKVPKVKSIFFNVGNQRMIYPGNKTSDLMECKINDFDTDNNEIVLQFYEMKQWHFTANIYLEVLGYDGIEYKYPVYLIKGDDNKNTSGATSVAASLFVLTCSVLAVMSVLKSS